MAQDGRCDWDGAGLPRRTLTLRVPGDPSAEGGQSPLTKASLWEPVEVCHPCRQEAGWPDPLPAPSVSAGAGCCGLLQLSASREPPLFIVTLCRTINVKGSVKTLLEGRVSLPSQGLPRR